MAWLGNSGRKENTVRRHTHNKCFVTVGDFAAGKSGNFQQNAATEGIPSA